ncbi:hypothetical protein GCM10009113_04030 [Marinobacter szutsaonensis]
MNNTKVPNCKFVFMFPDIAEPTVHELEQGNIPKEILNGYYQLLENGWDVTISDARWKGPFAKLRRKIKRFITLPSLGMFRDWLPADVIVIKDDFSLSLSLCAKLMGKKLVYLDAMFSFPKRAIRNVLIKLNLLLADRVICFSRTQAESWSIKYGVPQSKFSVLRYSIDAEFYQGAVEKHVEDSNKVIAIGRDLGRDFETLAEAVRDKDISLYLVTLPYLLPVSVSNIANVHVKQRLNYSELMDLYQQSVASIVPLIGELTYPSGIRAVMEAMAVGKPVIATRTPVLAEYFTEGEEITFVKAKCTSDMVNAIEILMRSKKLQRKLIDNAHKKLCDEYNVEKYVHDLQRILVSFTKSEGMVSTASTDEGRNNSR